MMLTLTSPFKTPLHAVPVGAKLAALAASALILLPLRDPLWVGAALVLVAVLYLSQGGRFARHGLTVLRPLWLFALVIVLWQAWRGDLAAGLAISGKMIAAVALANLVTLTSRLSDMMALVERLAAPLARLGLLPKALSPAVLALAMALVIRFTPVLMGKAEMLAQAWRARARGRASWRIVVPMVLVALDDAERVAEALRARGGI